MARDAHRLFCSGTSGCVATFLSLLRNIIYIGVFVCMLMGSQLLVERECVMNRLSWVGGVKTCNSGLLTRGNGC